MAAIKGELWSGILLMGREGDSPAQEEFTALLAYTTVNTKIYVYLILNHNARDKCYESHIRRDEGLMVLLLFTKVGKPIIALQ